MICSKSNKSVSVLFMLEWTFNLNSDVVGLIGGELGELGSKSWQVEGSDLLVELLWELVNLTSSVFVGVLVLPELDLGENLVSK